ncbi:MAG: TolC family protein, partial [Acidobacteria bacterium]|nr:TolC family protein [Acidobacteriota bacterium]
MKVKSLLFLISSFLFFPLLAQEEKKITIDEAISTAIENNKLLSSAKYQIEKAKGAKMEAFSNHFPKFDLLLSYSRTDNPVYVFMGKLTQEKFSMMDFDIDSLNSPPPLTNYQGKISLSLPIYSGGKINAYNKASEFGIKASESKYSEAKESVIEGVTNAFYGALLAEEAVKVYEEAVDTAKEHERQISLMHKEGLVLDSDLLRIRVYLKDVEQELFLS